MYGLICCLGLGMVVGAAEDVPAVRRLLTFEKEECLKYAGYKEVKGDVLVIRYNSYGTYHYMRQGDATEGEWAVAKSFRRRFDPLAGGITESGMVATRRPGRLFNGFMWMRRRGLAGDWSAWDRLWLDVKSTDAPARIRVTVADRLTVPLSQRRYDIPAGKWVTLQFDLARAADRARLERVQVGVGQARFFRCRGSAFYPARTLDPADVWHLLVNVEKVAAPSTVLLDNIRLVRAGAKVKPNLPLITDTSPWPVPEVLPAVTRPPGRKPLTTPPGPALRGGKVPPRVFSLIDLTKVRGVSYGRLHNDRCGIAVVDARRMAFTVAVGMNRCLLVTADGGRTWRGLDGTPTPTPLFSGNLMMVGATCTPAADGSDLLLVTLKHCAGGEEPSWVHFKKVEFRREPLARGAGSSGRWVVGPTRVVDVDSWHCPEHAMDVLRLPNGRLWAAWTPTTRTEGLAVTARYSDDGGATWRDLGSNGVIGGRGRPLLLPYGDGVACFRSVGWRGHITWSHTENGSWTKPERVGAYSHILAGITIGDRNRTILLACGRPGNLLRLEGRKWVRERVPFVPLRLSRAGDRVVALGLKDKRTILMSVRSAGGTWTPARKLFQEEDEILDLAVPMWLPGDFVPVIWAPRNHRWVKFLRVSLPSS